ncbi:hypothetical protein GQ53DRAFT_842302 [Thozetella sp. PMI_491]|nr:hypothetical protein GQ53DRAFT_842302 [Thozetella sp. PMI_491]
MASVPLPNLSFAPEPAPDASSSPVTFTCHCLRVTVTIPAPPQRINECHCSICYRYGALWAYYLRGQVRITGETQAYAREDADGNGDLAFHRCAHCGCLTHWMGVRDTERRKRLGPEAKMGVNCRMLPESEIAGAERLSTRRVKEDK